MFGVRNWLTPMHSTSSFAFSIFLTRFSPICVGMAFLRGGSALPSIACLIRARNAPMVRWRGTGGEGTGIKATMSFRARYILIGGLALLTAAGLIGWHFFDRRGEVLKPDGGPVITVMDFGRSFPLDPLPSGWRHRKFWTRSPMSMVFAIKDGVPSMRFETHDSASMLFRHVDIDLAAYPMLAWRWYIELPIRSPLDERTREGDDHRRDCFFGSRRIVARSARWR